MEVYVNGTPGDEKSVDWNTRFKVLNNDYALLGAPYIEGVVSRKEFGTYYEGAEGDEGNFMGEDQANYGEPDFYVSKDI